MGKNTGKEYTPETVDTGVKIDPKTGANVSGDVISAEEAQRLMEANAQKPAAVATEEESEVTPEEITALLEKETNTPNDLTDDEKAFLEEYKASLASTATPAKTDKQEGLTQEEFDALQAKIDKGETLTAEEQAIVDSLSDEPVEDKEYTVGGISKKRSEILTEMGEEDGIDYSQLTAEAQDKLLTRYLDSKNKTAWQRSLTQKSQETAEQRRQNELALSKIVTEATQVAKSREQLEKQIKKLEAFANSPLTKDDVIDDPTKQREYFRKLDAEEQLPELREEKKELDELASQYVYSQQEAEIALFQSAFPQYQMTEKFAEVLKKYDDGLLTEDNTDADSLLDIVDIAQHAKKIGKSLEVAYKDMVKLGRLRIKPQQSKPQIPKPKPGKTDTLAQKLARRQANATSFLTGKGGKPVLRQPLPKKPLGTAMREASSKALGGSDSADSPLSKMGF